MIVNISRRRLIPALAGALLIGAFAGWWQQRDARHFLDDSPSAFAAQFAPPTAADSAATRAELDELLALQATRTPAQVAAARADRKTSVARFYGALGFGPTAQPSLPRVERLAERVEDDVRVYVRAAKDRFRRLRPYELETRLAPCIDNVRGDLSYPSGHAAYGYSMAYLLSLLVPERSRELETRAEEFARQRMVCGVHFRSDLDAGQRAARLLIESIQRNPQFRAEAADAAAELRAALALGPLERESRAAQAGT